MSRPWRTMAVVCLACGLSVAGTAPALAQSTTGPMVTISAQTKFRPVTRDVFVEYSAGKYSVATLKGAITGAKDGELAALYAQRFPFTRNPVPVKGQVMTLSPAGSRPVYYHFTAKPTLATKFSVRILRSGTASKPVAISPDQIVYVLANDVSYGVRRCGRPVCHESVRIYTRLPGSVFRAESGKHWYFYFGLKLLRYRRPPYPRVLALDPSARVSRPERISSTEFRTTISWSFRIGNDGYAWLWTACTKDTEVRDGLNLPGLHGCGRRTVRMPFHYLG
jgi:hypothetical protein